MREILFRGKRKDNGEWVEGYYAKPKDYLTEKEVHAIFSLDLTLYPHSEFSSYEEIIPETVGQYTGLTDKNGKKIFEGDIVAGAVSWQERAKNGIVAFRYGSFGLIWYRGEIEQFNPFTSMCNIALKIIGNIHDNPELLKGGE